MSTTLRTPSLALVATLAVGALAACQQPAEEPEVTPDAEQVEPAQVQAAPAIDTTAEAVHAHLQDESYRDSWALWPGLEPYYSGNRPHGLLLTTYLNEAAQRGLEAMRAGEADDLPFGSMVVKENFMPDSTLAAVTVMYKREGYDPAHNDWFWLKRNADGSVDVAGRGQGCIDCHSEQGGAEHDYLRTAADQMAQAGG